MRERKALRRTLGFLAMYVHGQWFLFLGDLTSCAENGRHRGEWNTFHLASTAMVTTLVSSWVDVGTVLTGKALTSHVLSQVLHCLVPVEYIHAQSRGATPP